MNDARQGESRMCSGMEFQINGAQTLKARLDRIGVSRTIYAFLALFSPCYSSTNFLGQLFQYRVYVFQYRNSRDLGGY